VIDDGASQIPGEVVLQEKSSCYFWPLRTARSRSIIFEWQFATHREISEMATVDAKKAQTADKDRMHFRLDPKIKARVARAAAITGQGLTDFAVSTLSEKADQILERHHSIVLTSDEYSFFLNALADDRKPSKRSRVAAQRYRRGRRKGVRYRFGN
jgi:uncharacterized protein (DUF1778 family)